MTKQELNIVAEAVKSMHILEYMLVFKCYSVKAVNRHLAARYALHQVCLRYGIDTGEMPSLYLDDMQPLSDYLKSIQERCAQDTRE